MERFVENLVQNTITETVDSWEKKILIVGVVALDYIAIVDEYPDEDEEVMAVEHYLSRGGNAANSATVLGLLGANSEFFGTVVKNRDFDFIKEEFSKSSVCSENIVVLDPNEHKPAVTFIWVSKKSGSRTIIADFKNLTELESAEFEKLDLSNYQWIHFEGRDNVDDIKNMTSIVDKFNADKHESEKIIVSVEIELPPSVSPKLQELFDRADYVFVSKDFGRAENYTSKEETAEGLLNRCKDGATIVCPWGEDGAAAMKDRVVTSHAFPPDHLIDTIGAGDTFIAGLIFSMCTHRDLEKAVGFACKLAGAKCGMRGFSCLKGYQKTL